MAEVVRVSCTLAQLGGRLRRLGPQMERALQAAARDFALRLLVGVQDEITRTTPHQPVNTGEYRAGWRFRRLRNGAVVFNNTPQAVWIERGRRAGPISAAGFENLKLWVRRKGLYVGELAAATQSVRRRRLGELGASLIRAEVGGARMRAKGAVSDGGRAAILKRHRREVAADAVTEAVARVAWAIRESISRHGYHARFPLWRAIRAMEGEIGKLFADAMARGIRG